MRSFVAVLLAASLGLTACGSSGSPAASSFKRPSANLILDTEKVERAIERSSLEQRGVRAQVSCPSGVYQEKGLEFSCTAVVKRGGSTKFVVTELDAAGRVRYEAR